MLAGWQEFSRKEICLRSVDDFADVFRFLLNWVCGVFGGEVTCVFLNKKYVFIVFEDVVYT